VKVLHAETVAAATTDMIEDAAFSERLRPGRTRGRLDVVSMVWSRSPSSFGTLHKIIVLSVFLTGDISLSSPALKVRSLCSQHRPYSQYWPYPSHFSSPSPPRPPSSSTALVFRIASKPPSPLDSYSPRPPSQPPYPPSPLPFSTVPHSAASSADWRNHRPRYDSTPVP
jgi:hypothetical protein